MGDCHLGFPKQRKVGETKKFLPRGWSMDERKGGREGEVFLPFLTHPLPSFYQHVLLVNKTPALQSVFLQSPLFLKDV